MSAAVVVADADKARAEIIKTEANKLFADKHYDAAINQYTAAIELNPAVPAYYSNRALAYIRTESFGYAVNDADLALKLDPTFIKAYYRRATANMAMLRFKEAMADLRAVVKMNPRDPDAKQKLDECEKIIRRVAFEKAIASDDIQKSAFDALGDIDSIMVEPTYTGPHLTPTGAVTPEFVVQLMDHYKAQKNLHKKYAYQILLQAKNYFAAMDSLVDIAVPTDGRLIICGDTHGQFYDLVHIFELAGMPSANNNYLFNGDMVDRGSFSIEVIFTLLAFALAYPGSMHLARGNHEAIDMNRMYGFEGECKAKHTPATFGAFTEVFNALPLVHVVDKALFVVHGGLPSTDGVWLDEIRQINRFRQPTGNDIMNDLLWADPQILPGRGASKRGTGFQFGPDVTKRFLDHNGLKMVIRSHEVKEKGYEIMHDGKCVTIFSAPNYCDAVGNNGAYIVVKPDLSVVYEEFEAVPHPDIGPMKYAALRGFGG
ncbi:serine/threonine-protein phosphatase 5-like protein [Blastocladiella britannica]|nr:serine/threonine-protein phosphatase 5-like protein [Blastocladiella britannica]